MEAFLVATIAAGTSAQYYVSLTGYYTQGGEPPGRWLHVGFAAGVEPGTEVALRDFERLHAGLDLHGRQLLSNDGGKIARVGGYDMTFSAPKSVSVLWGLSDFESRKLIEAAQACAVAQATELLQKQAAFCRIGKGGAFREKVRLTVAAFVHGDARPAKHMDGLVFADPNLHTHAVILNLGQKAGGRIGALDGKALFNWKMAAGAAYHLSLANELQRLGLGITDIGKNGTFEIAGVDQRVCDYFSARRALIEAELAASGVTSAEAQGLAASVTKATRLTKQEIGGQDRHALWSERLHALVQSPAEIALPQIHLGHRSISTISEQQLTAVADNVLRSLTETESSFELRQLYAALSTALVGSGAELSMVGELFAKLSNSGKIVTLDRDIWGHGVMTTPEMIAIEREVFIIATDLGNRPSAGVKAAIVDKLIAARALSEEQHAAIRAATSGKRITVIEGAPGAGKTTTLQPIKEAWEASGYRVIGAASAWKIAHMLRDDLGIEARALDSWLAGAEAGRPFLDTKTVMIVDEAGLQGSRQMLQLLRAVQAAAIEGRGGPRLILVGDRNQLQSISAGSGLGIVASAIGVQRVETIQRQKEAWARDAIQSIGKGDAGNAIKTWAARGQLKFCGGAKAAITALVDAWDQAGQSDPVQTRLMIAATNSQVQALSTEARFRLRAQGLLIGKDFNLRAVTPSGQATNLTLAIGDRVRFLVRANIGDQEVINGTEAVIDSIRPSANGELSLTARIGRRQLIFAPSDMSDANGRIRLTHAYASTVYGAQGLTVDRAYTLITPQMNRHAAYVALSRARESTELFVDAKAVDLALRQAVPLAARQAFSVKDDNHRLEFIGKQLSRSGLKRTTLDIINDQATHSADRPLADMLKPAGQRRTIRRPGPVLE